MITIRTIGLVALAATITLSSCVVPEREKESVTVMITGAAKNVTWLTQDKTDEGGPVVSPDGKTLAYHVLKGEQYDIWTLDTATGRNRIQTTNHPNNDYQPSWTSDSKSVVFSSNRLGRYMLWKQLASGGGGTTMITKGTEMTDFAPAVSPDGKKVVFTSKGMEEQVVQVYGAEQYQIFLANLPHIWMVDMSGSNLTQFSRGAYPVWAPDSKRIAYSSDISGNWDIWIMDVDGAAQTQLTSDKTSQISPSFSPDGKWLVYTSDVSGSYDLWMMQADGGSPTQLTIDKRTEASPWWGADGNIYFTSNKAGNWDIWRLTPVLPE